MSKELRSHLAKIVRDDVAVFSHVEEKKMFGCEAFFASGKVFAIIWKAGRIGVKLSSSDARARVLQMQGAIPWSAGNRVMKEWVLIPETCHEDSIRRRALLQQAYEDATTII